MVSSTLSKQRSYDTGIEPFTGGASGRTSFFLDFFFVTFLGSLSLLASICFFLAGLASVVAGNTSEVRFGVRGEFLSLTIKAPSWSPTASSITRTNSWRTGDEQRSLFLEAAGGARMEEQVFSRPLNRAAGFTSAEMFFFLRVKYSVTRGWDILQLLLTATGFVKVPESQKNQPARVNNHKRHTPGNAHILQEAKRSLARMHKATPPGRWQTNFPLPSPPPSPFRVCGWRHNDEFGLKGCICSFFIYRRYNAQQSNNHLFHKYYLQMSPNYF